MTNRTPTYGGPTHVDAVLSAAAHEHRRAVIRELDHTDGNEMSFNTLTDHVAAAVRSDGSDGLAGGHRRRVRTTLHHTHLPKLEDCGLIVYDTETTLVRSVPGKMNQDALTVVTSFDGRE